MTQYIVDVTYNSGEVALYGPFDASPQSKTEKAIDFINRIKNATASCVVEAKIRVLNNL